jgi:membrane fusion protein, multidrug efflux system
MNRTRSLFFVLVPTLFVASCANQAKQPAQAPETVRNVSLVEAQERNMPDGFEAVGTVQAAQTSILASQMMGNIVEIRVHEGDRVRRGQILAVIDDSQPRAAVARATAADTASQRKLAAADSELVLANSTLKRFQTLFERKSVSPQEFDEVQARQQSALAQRDIAQAEQNQAAAALTQAKTTLQYTLIRAPFDGVVSEKKADIGTLASPGTPIFTVEDVHRYRLAAPINENDLSLVRVGQLVPVVIDAFGSEVLKGKVVQVVPAVDPGTRSFRVKIELPPDSGLRSGLFGRVQFSRGERRALFVPQTAIVQRGQMQGVFLLDQSKIAALHYVTVGKPIQSRIEVLAGLQSGDWLVATPGTLELDGKRIEAQ